MKRCPECGRDYNDPTLSFCLDDGAALLDGPASMDEPLTAILPETGRTSESRTRTLDPADAEETKLYGERAKEPGPKTAPGKNTFIVAVLGILAVTALGFGGYWFFGGESTKQISSLAVMPFVNESGNPDIEYLSDGMTESLISSLSTLPNLAVKARSTVFFYKGKQTSPKTIGEDLNVEAVLLGRVAGKGDNLRLNLELVNTRTEDVIWSETYDRGKSDLVALQSEVARDVSGKIRAKLTGEEEQKVSETGTSDPSAYQAYLRGRFLWNKRGPADIRRSIEEFKTATTIDPGYALAYAAIAESYVVISGYSGERERSEDSASLARDYAERAIALNGKLAAPYAALGLVELHRWHWQRAEENFKKAIELDPNYPTALQWYSVLLRNEGKFDKAAEMAARAKELDPLSSIIGLNFSEILQIQGKWQESIDNSLRVVELTPNFVPVHFTLGFGYLKTGQFDKSIAAFEKGVNLGSDPYGVACLAYAHAKTGNRAEAVRIIESLEKDYDAGKAAASDIAVAYVGLGDKDEAFKWLEKSFEARDIGLMTIKWEPGLRSIENDPRYSDLLKRMGLPN